MTIEVKSSFLFYSKIIYMGLIVLLLSSSKLQAQDYYPETYKAIAEGLDPKNYPYQLKAGFVTVASVGLKSSQSLNQNGFYGFGKLHLDEPTKNSLTGKVRIYASKYEYKNVLDLTPTQDLFPLNQAVYEYKLQLFPSGKVSYQLLINGKLFLNRPPTVVQAHSFQKGYIQAGPLMMYIKVGSVLPKYQKPEVEIAYTPVVNFENLSRDQGKVVLAVGVNRMATVYRIDKITNNSNKDFTLFYKNFRTVADQSADAYFGSGTSSTILSLVASANPSYFVAASSSVTVPSGKTVELSAPRIVIVYSSMEKSKPFDLIYNQEGVQCTPIPNSDFELIPDIDIMRINNFH